MINYIRTCLSLDGKTIDKITQLTWTLGAPDTRSGIVKEAIEFLWNHIATWKIEKHLEKEEKCNTKSH